MINIEREVFAGRSAQVAIELLREIAEVAEYDRPKYWSRACYDAKEFVEALDAYEERNPENRSGAD